MHSYQTIFTIDYKRVIQERVIQLCKIKCWNNGKRYTMKTLENVEDEDEERKKEENFETVLSMLFLTPFEEILQQFLFFGIFPRTKRETYAVP